MLHENGEVSAVGYSTDGQCNTSGWTDVTEVAAGGDFSVALKKDGTVVATGENGDGQCNVSSWKLK